MTIIAEAYIHWHPVVRENIDIEHLQDVIRARSLMLSYAVAHKLNEAPEDFFLEIEFDKGGLKARIKLDLQAFLVLAAAYPGLKDMTNDVISISKEFSGRVIEYIQGQTKDDKRFKKVVSAQRRTCAPGRLGRAIKQVEKLEEEYFTLSGDTQKERLDKVIKYIEGTILEFDTREERLHVLRFFANYSLPDLPTPDELPELELSLVMPKLEEHLFYGRFPLANYNETDGTLMIEGERGQWGDQSNKPSTQTISIQNWD